MKFTIENYINEHQKILSKINQNQLQKIIDLIYEAHLKGRKIFTCGNGGSESNASHMITDWNKMKTMATCKYFSSFQMCLKN